MGESSGKRLPGAQHSSLVNLLRARAEEQPDKTAYTFLAEGEQEGESLTFRELDRRARSIAAALQRAGASGGRALLLYPPGLDFVAGFLGCLYAGTVAVPGYPPRSRRSLPRLLSIARDARPLCALTDSASLSKFEALASEDSEMGRVRWLATDSLDPAFGDLWLDPGVGPETLAFLQYTSGSTAAPKGVMVTHGNLLHNEGLIQEVFGQSEDSVIVGWLPLYHDMGLIGNVLQPLFLGASCVLMSPLDFLQRPRRWLEAVSRYRATTSGGPNFAYELCVHKVPEEQREGLDLSSWTVAFNGAEPIRATTLDRFARAYEPYGFRRQAFLPCYGLAEATLMVTGKPSDGQPVTARFDPVRLEEGNAEEHEGGRRLVGSGSRPAGQLVEVVDPESGELRPAGRVGEIWISGPSVAGGYWNRRQQTEETFRARIPGREEAFLRTGDLGFLNGGELFVTGRLKDLIIIRGRNHYPQDLELTAETSHRALRPGCGAAFSVEVDGEEQLVLVQEVRREALGDDLDAVADAIRLAVTENHDLQARDVVLLRPGGVPKTSSGKIQRSRCRQLYLEGNLKVASKGSARRRAATAPFTADGAAGPRGFGARKKERGGAEEAPVVSAADLRSLSGEERSSLLAAYLRQEAARALRQPADGLEDDQPLVMDSLAAMELKSRLETELKLALPLEIFFETPALADLAATVEQALETTTAALPPVRREAELPVALPLSHGQRAFWFLERLTPGTGAYHVSFAARLRNGRDPRLLLQGLQLLVERHEVLRTVIATEEGEPVQRTADAVQVPLREFAAEEWTEEQVRDRMRQETRRAFDLEQGPLLRFSVFRRFGGPVLLLVVHHLVTDLWSLVLLAEELDHILPELAKGDVPALAERSLRYGDFVLWQRRLLASAEGEELWSYWRETLKGAPRSLELPADRPRSAGAAAQGDAVALRLDAPLAGIVAAAAETAGTTTFAVLTAAFQLLLHRVTGQTDLLVGAPATGRGRTGLTEVVGYLVNTLVLRSRNQDDPVVLDYLRRTGAGVRGALEHQDFPYPLLVEKMRPERDAGHGPLVQAFLTLEKPHRPELASLASFALGKEGAALSLGGLELESVAAGSGSVQFDLELVLAETPVGLEGILKYSTGLFDATTAHRLAAHYENLLGAMTGSLRGRLSHLHLVGRPERHQILHEWNSWAGMPKRRSFPGLVREVAAALGDRPAIVFEDGSGGEPVSTSYRELLQRVDALTAALHRNGVGREDVVGVALPRSPEVAVALLAVQQAGGCYLPLDPDYPEDRLQYMLEDSSAKLVVTVREVALKLGLAERAGEAEEAEEGLRPRALCLDGAFGETLAQLESGGPLPALAPNRAPLPAGAAYTIYTSGSTGRPKGAVLTHEGLVNLALAQSRAFGVGPGSRVLQFAALSFDASISEMAMAFAVGGTLCLSRSPDMMPGPGLAKLLDRLEISHVTLPPSSLAALPVRPLKALETLVCAGEDLGAGLVQRWARHCRVFNAYGPTEATVCSTLVPCLPDGRKPAIGGPLDNVRCYVVCRNLQLLPAGVPGELYVGGVSLGRGYHGRAALTAQRFVPDPSGACPGARLYRTGDLVLWRPDGRIEFLGRIDQQVKVRGFRVEPGEVEDALTRHPAVASAVVAARYEGPAGGRLLGYFVPAGERRGETRELAQELKEYLREQLPAHMVPSILMALDALPTTPSGKVDRKALPDPLEPATAGRRRTPPGSTLERAVAAVWKQALGVSEVGLDDNFFDLGGHSLLVAQVHERLQGLFETEVSMVDLFRYPTIRTLVQHYTSVQGASPAVGGASRAAARLRALSEGGDRSIAVVGMACRFPGASSPDELWQLLRNGVEAVTELDAEALAAAGAPAGAADDPSYVKSAVLLDDVDAFDATYFGYTPKEAESMDPQHRFFLEAAVEGLEDAGCDPDRYPGAIGVFAGAGLESYLMGQLQGDLSPAAAYQLTIGNLRDFLASRVSYKLDLSGPSVAVQTACSTSLVAVHMACQSLLLGESDMALAGGVSIEIPQGAGYRYQDGMIFSPDGHCRPFDADAAGTVRGSGVGIVVLKRLTDALKDGDRIRAVIRGSAVNNDGSRKIGYTAPSVERQSAVISEALAVAGVDPETVTYVEAHGTGTEMGDPIEVEALTTAHRGAGAKNQGYCALGSIKSNFGHLDTAAGAAGLIKTVLALEHGEIPPSLNYEKPNPRIDFAASPFYVNDRLKPWASGDGPRRAGVSSFGIGGTNAHVVLEEAPAAEPAQSAEPAQGAPRPWHLLTLSARSESALDRQCERLAESLKQRPEMNLADVAYTLQTGRRSLDHRRLLVARDGAEAAEALGRLDPERLLEGRVQSEGRPVVFLFPGQGAQHPDMGRGLYREERVFRETVDHCCEILEPHLGLDLRDLLYPEAEARAEAAVRLTETRLAQPALFVVELALAKLWEEWGVVPQAMLGHSIGELVAATLAEVFSLEDALGLVAARGQLMQQMEPGSMLSVKMAAEEIAPLLPTGISVAAVNAPGDCVVSGPSGIVDDLARWLEGRGTSVRPLVTSHAFHSAMMEPAAQAFQEVVAGLRLSPPSRRYVSNLSGTWIEAEEATDPAYWARQLREPVLFAAGVEELLQDPACLLLEVGPGEALSSLARRHTAFKGTHVALASLPHPKERTKDLQTCVTTAGRLWLAGCTVDWQGFHGERRRRRVDLPTYAFDRQRFWAQPAERSRAAEGEKPATRPRELEDWFYLPSWQPVAPVRGMAPEEGTRWVVFTDSQGLGEEMARRLEAQAGPVIRVRPGASFAQGRPGHFTLRPGSLEDHRALLGRLGDAGTPLHLLHLWLVTGDEEPAADAHLERGFFDLLALGRTLADNPVQAGVTLSVVTDGAQAGGFPGSAANGGGAAAPLSPAKAAALGPVRVLGQELSNLRCRAVDLELPPTERALGELAGRLLRDLRGEEFPEVAVLRDGILWREQQVPLPLPEASAEEVPLRHRGVYLITGGFGGLGMALARHLARKHQARLVLTSRSPLPERSRWQFLGGDDPASARVRAVRELEELGAEVLTLTSDVADELETSVAVAETKLRFGGIDGVFHTAGVSGLGLARSRSRREAEAVLAPKLQGAFALGKALEQEDLDFLVLYSSLNATLGGVGGIDYCAANCALEVFAEDFGRRHPETYTCAVAWGGWEEVGMGAGADGKGRSGLKGAVEVGIPTEQGLEALERILAHRRGRRILVSPEDFPSLYRSYRWPPAIEEEGKAAEGQKREAQTGQRHPRPPLQTRLVRPGTELEKQLAEIWQEHLAIEEVGVLDNFFELGGTSLVGIEMISSIKQRLGIELPAVTLYEGSTIRTLAEVVERTAAPQKPQAQEGVLHSPEGGRRSGLGLGGERPSGEKPSGEGSMDEGHSGQGKRSDSYDRGARRRRARMRRQAGGG